MAKQFNPLKPDIILKDYKGSKEYGLKLDGTNGLQIGTITQDDSVHIRAAGKRVGDFDEQRSWAGGIAVENLSDNSAGFWDSKNAWTLTDGHLYNGLLWEFSRGIRGCDFDLPSRNQSMAFKRLHGATRYFDVKFTSEGFDAQYARIWVRSIGYPGALRVDLCQDNAGDPGTVLKTDYVYVSDIEKGISKFQKVNWQYTGLQTLTAGNTYHLKFTADAADDAQQCWEIGGNAYGSNGKVSSDGTTWAADSFSPYFFVADEDLSRRFHTFFLDGSMYVVDEKDSGAASQLWINGTRGKATSATTTTLTDTAQSMTAGQYDTNGIIKIVRGTGKGQIRPIWYNTATVINISSGEPWDITPDTTSEYIIYSTEYFNEITGHSLGRVTGEPVVVNRQVYFPQGSGDNIRTMIYNATTKAHAFSDDSTNKADFMQTITTALKTWVVAALAQDATVKWAEAQAYSTTPTALSFGTAKLVGNTTSLITGLVSKDEFVYVFKEDGVFNQDSNLNTVGLSSAIDDSPSSYNGFASLVHQQFIYYSWQTSLIRVFGSQHDDIGLAWSEYVPEGRQGNFSSLDSYMSLLVGGIDAGIVGTSSVLGFNGIAFHEVFRSYDTGERVKSVKIQPCQYQRNRLWTGVGSNFVFQELPYERSSPILDDGCRYMHEFIVESSVIDMGTASNLPKMIKELTVFSKNLGGGNSVYVDYQVDDDIRTSTWTEAFFGDESPETTIYLGVDNIRKFVYRLRVRSEDNTTPVDILGVVPNGYARVPFKLVWTIRARADNIVTDGKLAKPDQLIRWLLDTARFPGRVTMESQWALADNFNVIVHPPHIFPYKPSFGGQEEESIVTIVLQEA